MPRTGLTPRLVVETGAQLADEVGWDRFTLAAVAERLQVKLPSLYKHIDGLDALRHEVAVAAMHELADRLRDAAVGRSRTDALLGIADAYRAYGLQHPGRYTALVRAPAPDDVELTRAAERVLQVVFAVLGGYGLSGDDVVDATRALRAALHGFVDLEAGGGFGMPQDIDRSYHRLIDGFDATLTRWATTTPETPHE